MPATAAIATATPRSAGQRPDGYERRRPEESVLYQVVQAHWPDFLERAEEQGGLPRFVVREFEEYLRCGILEHGLVRLACRRCGHEIVIGMSCKRRGFCPSCCGRRMSDIAAHLLDSVLPPDATYRQWVCTVPWKWRTAIGYDRDLCADVLDAFASSLLRHLRWRVKRTFGLSSVKDAEVGAITFIQRNDSALRLSPHFHTLAADGAWVSGEDGELRFLPLPEPTAEEVAQLASWTHARLLVVLERHGRLDDLAADQPVLASCYGAAAADVQILGAEPGSRTQKLFGPVRSDPTGQKPVAEVGGVNLFADTAIDGRDRRRLERLCRYMARPPLCAERLEVQDDGKVRYEFRGPWKDGTRGILLAPLDFIARLCALVPPPRFHTVRYHGLFSGGSAVRQAIVPGAQESPPPKAQLSLLEPNPAPAPPPDPTRHPWAWLLRRVYAADLTVCPVRDCKGEMRIAETATAREHIDRVLAKLGLAPRPPTKPDKISARQLALPLNF